MQRVLLVGLNVEQKEEDFERSMDELESLAEACAFEVVYTVTQNASVVNKATLIGSGKVREVKTIAEDEAVDAVIFNHTLSPMQIRNLGQEIGREVLDRTGVILEIFFRRAKTREAVLQVEYARLAYMLPRLAGMRANLGRQGGTSGSMSNRGAGEKKIELDRRHIEKRMSQLREELKHIAQERDTQRARRLSSGDLRVSLVGYTNAGKSTIMNALLSFASEEREEKKVLEKDMLFATLDTTVRKIQAEGMRPFLLADTVGFIDELPHTLVKAFRSTLEEAVYADLILEIVDYSDPDHKEHRRVTERTLQDIGAGAIPRLTVYNKVDRVLEAGQFPKVYEDRIYLSAKEGRGISELLEMIEGFRSRTEEVCRLHLTYQDMSVLDMLKRNTIIMEEKYTEDGVEVLAQCKKEDVGRLKKYIC